MFRIARRTALFSLVAGALAVSAHADASLSFESNTYRSGHDVLARTDAPSAIACAVDCSLVDGCRAWSYANVCELRPAMGMSSRASGAESGLYFPGIGHIALRDANMDDVSANEPVPPILRLNEEPEDTQPAEPVKIENVVVAEVETATQGDDPYAPRKVASWSFASGVTPASTNTTLDDSTSDQNFSSSNQNALPPGAVEEDGVIYIDSDDVDDDFFELRP
ncbi:MAG: hypothetical protein AAF216_04655 [Pseudomonadota bacterium]